MLDRVDPPCLLDLLVVDDVAKLLFLIGTDLEQDDIADDGVVDQGVVERLEKLRSYRK